MTVRTLNATAASLLGLLHEGPMTGWDLLQRAQDRIGSFWTLTQSQVYRELTAMAAAGLVEVGPPGPRERKPHSLTDAGRAAFAHWVDQEPGPDQIRIPLLLTVAFAEHLPGERLREIVAVRRAEAVERLARYEAGREKVDDPTRLVTLEYGVRHERAVIEWFDLLPDLLDLP